MIASSVRPFVLVSLVASAGLCSAAAGQTGQDFGFGTGGLARAGVAGQSENWLDVTTQPDGKIVAVGSRTSPANNVGTENFFVARFLPSGVLDTSFNGTGTFEFDFGLSRYDRATSVNILPDGKILIGGNSIAYENIPNQFFVERLAASDIALIRLNANGTLDTTFGVNGSVRTDLSNLRDDTVVKVFTLADGSIRVAGTSVITVGTQYFTSWALVAYEPNGTLNTAFGTAGRSLITYAYGIPFARALDAIVDNGKIVLTGTLNIFSPILVARADALTGQIDPSFGVGGIATVDIPEQPRNGITSRQGWSLAAQPDGKIIVAGDGAFFDTPQDTLEDSLLTVSRLNPDGTTDATFNAFPNDTIRGSAPSVTIANGAIVIADSFAPRFTLAANGAVAGNFGPFLVGINPLTWTTTLNFASLTVQASGGLLAAGTTNGDAAIARFTFDGSQTTPPVGPPPPPPPPPAPTIPAAPSNLAASAITATSVALAWRDNATNETSYVVQRSSRANFRDAVTLATLGANAAAFTDSTVIARTTYFYRVTARNAQGSATSATFSVTTPRR